MQRKSISNSPEQADPAFSYLLKKNREPGIIILINNRGISQRLTEKFESISQPIFFAKKIPERLWGYINQTDKVINILVCKSKPYSKTLKKIHFGLSLRGCEIIELTYEFNNNEKMAFEQLFQRIRADILMSIMKSDMSKN